MLAKPINLTFVGVVNFKASIAAIPPGVRMALPAAKKILSCEEAGI